ncbi:MAG: putative Holliday junction resolvase [Bacteroidia bacterium]|jgi:putative Holliday junction resolvase
MARIIAIDFGMKRVGIASTDPLQIIASPMTTVTNKESVQFITDYCTREDVEIIVVGQPFRMSGELSGIEVEIVKFIDKLKEKLPSMPIARVDERYTSKMAMQALIASGVKKKQRRDKSLLDSTSASLILQDYLENIQ